MEIADQAGSLDLARTKACHCLAARRHARELTRVYERRLRPHGLRATQFTILAVLSLKGPTAIGEFAEILAAERTTVTRGTRIMAENGWIREAPSENDRQRRWEITAAGRRKIEAAYPAWAEAQAEVERQARPGEARDRAPRDPKRKTR